MKANEQIRDNSSQDVFDLVSSEKTYMRSISTILDSCRRSTGDKFSHKIFY